MTTAAATLPPPVVGCDDDPITVLQHHARQAAITAATLLGAITAAANRAAPGYDADEISFALTWTHGATRKQIEFGRYLTAILPMVFASFARGDIDQRRAWIFYDVLATTEDPTAADIAERFITQAPNLTSTQLRERLRRAVLKADPDGAATRTRRSVAERYVGTSADNEGTATLYGVRLPADRTVAAFERVDAYARARKTDGETRTLDQLRADTFLDLLTGTHLNTPPIHRVGVIELTVPWDTAINLGNQPGHLTGYGPVAAPIARDIILTHMNADTRPHLRYSITGPTGELLHHNTMTRFTQNTASAANGLSRRPAARPPTSATATAANGSSHQPAAESRTPAQSATTIAANGSPAQTSTASPDPVARPPIEPDPTRRTPGAALSRWIIARDRTCRAPGCSIPARVADIDHTTAHTDGGTTSHDNLAVLCRHHHRTKHEAGWTVTQPTPGTLTWTSPTGHTYRRTPDPPE